MPPVRKRRHFAFAELPFARSRTQSPTANRVFADANVYPSRTDDASSFAKANHQAQGFSDEDAEAAGQGHAAPGTQPHHAGAPDAGLSDAYTTPSDGQPDDARAPKPDLPAPDAAGDALPVATSAASHATGVCCPLVAVRPLAKAQVGDHVVTLDALPWAAAKSSFLYAIGDNEIGPQA